MDREDRAISILCRRVLWHEADLDGFLVRQRLTIKKTELVARALWEGEARTCRRNNDLAIRLIEHAIGPHPIEAPSGDILGSLAYYLYQRNGPDDRRRSAYLQRVMDLRGEYSSSLPPVTWDAEQTRELAADDVVWRRLDRTSQRTTYGERRLLFSAVSDPKSSRFDPARALALAEEEFSSPEEQRRAAELFWSRPADDPVSERAEELLIRAARYDERARRLLLQRLEPRLSEPSEATRHNAVQTLSAWADVPSKAGAITRGLLVPTFVERLKGSDEEAKQAIDTLVGYALLGALAAERPVEDWISQSLFAPDRLRRKFASLQLLRLNVARSLLGARILASVIARSGGVHDVRLSENERARLKNILVERGYPLRAAREEIQGLVKASAISTPDGDIVTAVIEGGPGSPLEDSLMYVLTRHYQKADFSGRFERFEIGISFINECMTSKDKTQISLEDAVVIRASICPSSPAD